MAAGAYSWSIPTSSLLKFFSAEVDRHTGKELRHQEIPDVVQYFLGERNARLPKELETMMYLPPQAQLLFQNVHQANQEILANAPPTQEEARRQTERLSPKAAEM